MNLHDAIVDANAVFFDAESGFAEEVTFRPGGKVSKEFPINAIVDWGDEEGANQIRGEGRSSLNRDKGRSTRTTPIVEMPTKVTHRGVVIPVIVGDDGKDRIVVKKHGTDETVTLAVKRIIARDEAAQSVLCHFETQHQTQTRKSRFG